ncbi:MAG: 2-amino-4-hydroxy-6-hydroxymethyldihydropteridine diphosphokinase [Gammaproteobacteria bacterium]
MKGRNAVAPGDARAFVSVGSNIEPVSHLRFALQELERKFAPLSMSSVYRTRAIGFAGDDFLNLVVSFEAANSVDDLLGELDRIESSAGRDRQGDRFGSRTLDLDLLMYADRVIDSPQLQLPRPDIMKYAFVLAPLAELAPDLVHPLAGARMEDLWERLDKTGQSIRRLSPSPV